MTLRRLDDVAAIIMGQAPPGESYNTQKEGWPLIAGAGDFEGGKPLPHKYTTMPSKLSRDGDIVIGIRASIGEKVLADGEYCLGRGVAAIRPSAELDERYLWHWLGWVEPRLAAKGRGATFKQINRGDIGEMPIDLPSMEKQRHIGQTLDSATILIGKRQAGIRLLDELVESAFLEMFGDPKKNPQGWEVRMLRSVVREFRYGTSNKSGESGLPALRIPNVIGGALDLGELKCVAVSTADEARLKLTDGDLLFVRTNGNPDYVGRCAVFSEEAVSGTGFPADGFIYASYLIRARLRTEQVDPVFIREFMLSAAGREQLRARSKTSAGQYNINIDGLGGIRIPLPPIELQREFAARLKRVRVHRGAHTGSLATMNTLFASLQHQAFNGEL